MIVVSDTSPILSLALIEQLDLLREIYGSIMIPEAVRQELMVTDHNGTQEIAQAQRIIPRPTRTASRSGASVDPNVILKLLQREVDRGEAEAIGLAVQLNAEVLLIDECKARKLAQYLELNVVGLLDVLHESKQRQLIPLIKPALDDLLTHARFRLSRKLYQRILHTAGE